MRLLLIEPFLLLRAALSTHFSGYDDTVTIVEAGAIDEILQRPADDVTADAVLVSGLPRTGAGLSQIRALHAHMPDASIVLLTEPVDDAWLLESIAAGARGLIPKDGSPRVLFSGLEQVLSGEVFIPPAIMRPAGAGLSDRAGTFRGLRLTGALARLSRRQIEVLSLIAAGKSNGAIAGDLQIEKATVNNHVQAILKTLDVRNRTQAMLVAVNAGLIPLEPIGDHAA